VYKDLYRVFKSVVLYAGFVIMLFGVDMRLLFSALTGVLVAGLIFAAMVFVSWNPQHKVLLSVSVGGDRNDLLRLEGPRGVVYEWIGPPSKCTLNVTLSAFAQPPGLGSEADLTIALTSNLNYSEIFYVSANMSSPSEIIESFRQQFPGTVKFVDGGSRWLWVGSFEPNETKSFSHRIKATGVGTADLFIEATTELKQVTPGSGEYRREHQEVELQFVMVPDNVLVHTSIPYLEPRLALLPIDLMDLDYNWSLYRGLGSEFNASIRLFGGNATNVTAKLVMQDGIVLVEGQRVWVFNLTSGDDEVRFTAKLRFVQTGAWFMYAYVEKDGIILGRPNAIKFVVSEDNMMIYRLY
jgi:hypothetical protein